MKRFNTSLAGRSFSFACFDAIVIVAFVCYDIGFEYVVIQVWYNRGAVGGVGWGIRDAMGDGGENIHVWIHPSSVWFVLCMHDQR